MADPFSAFAIACNIVQIIETGTKILEKAVEYHNAADGALEEQRSLSGMSQSLKNLNVDLAAKLPRASQVPLSPAQQELVAANERCLRLSNDFTELMDSLKVDVRKSKFASLRMAVRSVRHRDRVQAMRSELFAARDNLNIALLVCLRESGSTMHADLLQSNQETERRIMGTFQAASTTMKADLEALSQQMDGMSINTLESIMSEFRSSHREFLDELSSQLKASLVTMQATHESSALDRSSRNDSITRKKILEGLYFPQIHDRKNSISSAHQETFEWILEPSNSSQGRWDNFSAWAESKESDRRIYWINGKPGCGKSTLMRFLDDRLDVSEHLSQWAAERRMVKAHYYFWSPGTPLQKRLSGLLRSMLFQILEQVPDRLPQLIPRRIWKTAGSLGQNRVDWFDSEMMEAIKGYIRDDSVCVFFLIDGLDEIEGTDDDQEQLIHFLLELSKRTNVKLCLSSRPWNIFQDAFGDVPHLRLQDLTHDDIAGYIQTQFNNNFRFNQLQTIDPVFAQHLVERIIEKASGVFLWVKLVVRELLKSLRDGDSLWEMSQKLESLPSELDAYFQRMMQSIEPQHRREASVLLQIATYEERSFITLSPLRLVDLSFVADFELQGTEVHGSSAGRFAFSTREALYSRLDTTLRRLNSRCLGVLECHYRTHHTEDKHAGRISGELMPMFAMLHDNEGDASHAISLLKDERMYDATAGSPAAVALPHMVLAYNIHVSFLHRSFRDFLLSPNIQHMLHEYSAGPFRANEFLIRARLAQLLAIDLDTKQRILALGLASFLISAIGTAEIKRARLCEIVAIKLQPIVIRLAALLRDDQLQSPAWYYIHQSLEMYFHEKSTFLTIAIDFDLEAFVTVEMTESAVRGKAGRPILDYILRGRFRENVRVDDFLIGNRLPNIALVGQALSHGADPNQIYQDGSVWARYLRSLGNSLWMFDTKEIIDDQAWYEREMHIQQTHMAAIRVMLLHGAHAVLPFAWLLPILANLPNEQVLDLESINRSGVAKVADLLRLLAPWLVFAQDGLLDCIDLAESIAEEQPYGVHGGQSMSLDE